MPECPVRARDPRSPQCKVRPNPEYEAKIAALERMVGRQALEIELLKGALKHAPRPRSAITSVVTARRYSRPPGVRADGPRTIHFLRYAACSPRRGRLVARIGTICDEFECYGYRRVGAALRHQGIVVNGKKLRRLMRENGLQPKRRRRYVVTTDSNHAGPIYPDLAKNLFPTARTSSGWRISPTSPSRRLRLSGGDPGFLVAQGGRLCNQPIDGRPHCRRG